VASLPAHEEKGNRTMRFKNLAFLASLMLVAAPAFAQSAPPALKLCPPTVHKTCFIGYVMAADQIKVFLSSIDTDPLMGRQATVAPIDLSKQIGSVVMLDATGKGENKIVDANLVSVADPLLTALYINSFTTTSPE
jgi:hypothetical protein